MRRNAFSFSMSTFRCIGGIVVIAGLVLSGCGGGGGSSSGGSATLRGHYTGTGTLTKVTGLPVSGPLDITVAGNGSIAGTFNGVTIDGTLDNMQGSNALIDLDLPV